MAHRSRRSTAVVSGGPEALGKNAQGSEPTGLRSSADTKVPKMPGGDKLLETEAAPSDRHPMAEQLKKLP